MNKDLTDITVVLDRSGSMTTMKSDAEGGLNQFIEDHKKLPGQAVFTLVQFDTEYEFVHRAVPIKDVPFCRLEPRGWTALLDAVGRAVTETGERLKNMDEKDRPGLVVVVIITDGCENASKEFNLALIKEMIERQSKVYKWQFTYIGANQDAFAEAGCLGITKTAALNFTQGTAKAAYAAASANVGRMRHSAANDLPIAAAYTDEERQATSQTPNP